VDRHPNTNELTRHIPKKILPWHHWKTRDKMTRASKLLVFPTDHVPHDTYLHFYAIIQHRTCSCCLYKRCLSGNKTWFAISLLFDDRSGKQSPNYSTTPTGYGESLNGSSPGILNTCTGGCHYMTVRSGSRTVDRQNILPVLTGMENADGQRVERIRRLWEESSMRRPLRN
jgi:hypothetical protein